MTTDPLRMIVRSSRHAQDGGEDDGRRVNGEAGAQAPLHEKQRRAEQAGFGVEPLAEIFIGGIDVQAAIDGQKHGGDEHQGQRHAEIILHEIQSAGIALAGSGDEGDGAGLRGGDRYANGQPADVFIPLQIVAQIAMPPRMEGGIGRDAQQAAQQDDEIEAIHEKAQVRATNKSTHKTKEETTMA